MPRTNDDFRAINAHEGAVLLRVLGPPQAVLGARKQKNIVSLASLTGIEPDPERDAAHVGQHISVVQSVSTWLLLPSHEFDRQAVREARRYLSGLRLEEGERSSEVNLGVFSHK